VARGWKSIPLDRARSNRRSAGGSHRYGDRTRALVLAAAAQPFARRRYAIGGSPINFADGLNGKLLIIHGTGDDNVHFQGTQRLLNKLISLNKQFHFMEYPNRRHGVRGSDPAHPVNTPRRSCIAGYPGAGPKACPAFRLIFYTMPAEVVHFQGVAILKTA
jgi:Prolyl oligopeptidase family